MALRFDLPRLHLHSRLHPASTPPPSSLPVLSASRRRRLGLGGNYASAAQQRKHPNLAIYAAKMEGTEGMVLKERSVSVILLSGGQGKRMGASMPKQYLPLLGVPIALHSLDTFCRLKEVKEVVVVCDPEYNNVFEGSIEDMQIPMKFACPGKERQDSVFNGLQEIAGDSELVCVHDSARPLGGVWLLEWKEEGWAHSSTKLNWAVWLLDGPPQPSPTDAFEATAPGSLRTSVFRVSAHPTPREPFPPREMPTPLNLSLFPFEVLLRLLQFFPTSMTNRARRGRAEATEMQQPWQPEAGGVGPAYATVDKVSIERSKNFVKALQELKNLRPQLYSASEYCKKFYLHSEQKQM